MANVITERSLKIQCQEANSGPLKSWSFGVKVERTDAGYMLYAVHRQPGGRKPYPLLLRSISAREMHYFILGIQNTANVANGGEGQAVHQCLQMVETRAAEVREENSYRGRVNQIGETIATILDSLATSIREAFPKK